MATNPNTQSVEPVWWLSKPTIMTNVPTEGDLTPFVFQGDYGGVDLQAHCDEMGEDLEMAAVIPFPVIVVADMSQGETKLYGEYTNRDLGEPFWTMNDQKQLFAQIVKGKWKQIPENITLGNWPARILALNFGGMQLFTVPMPTKGLVGALAKKNLVGGVHARIEPATHSRNSRNDQPPQHRTPTSPQNGIPCARGENVHDGRD